MPTVVCYGDSNTWGYDPASGERFAPDVRWPGVMRRHLPPGFEVIEEGLCGRTTIFDDPFMEKRNGLDYLTPCLDSHAPIDLVVLMLGTNDLKGFLNTDAAQIARGAGRLVEVIKASGAGPGDLAPRVLLVAPTPVTDGGAQGELWGFAGAPERARPLAGFLRMVAEDKGCAFLDAGQLIQTSPLDGVHFDAAAHQRLGRTVAEQVARLFASPRP